MNLKDLDTTIKTLTEIKMKAMLTPNYGHIKYELSMIIDMVEMIKTTYKEEGFRQ